MCVKTPTMAYYCHRVRSSSRSDLFRIIDDSPLTDQDRKFVKDILVGLSYKELANKYGISKSTVSYRKRKIYELLANYERLRPQTLSYP